VGKIRFKIRDNVRTMFPDRNVVLGSTGSTILALIDIQPGLLTVYKNIA